MTFEWTAPGRYWSDAGYSKGVFEGQTKTTEDGNFDRMPINLWVQKMLQACKRAAKTEQTKKASVGVSLVSLAPLTYACRVPAWGCVVRAGGQTGSGWPPLMDC